MKPQGLGEADSDTSESESDSSSEDDQAGPSRKRRKLTKSAKSLELPASIGTLFEDLEAGDLRRVLEDAVEVTVRVQEHLTVRLLEASVACQTRFVEAASASILIPPASVWSRTTSASSSSTRPRERATDPYGAALWPSGQVMAQAVAAYAKVLPPGSTFLELGAGCGLASVVAALAGFRVLATDYRQLPLALLMETARRQELPNLSTSVFDVTDLSVPLPMLHLPPQDDSDDEESVRRTPDLVVAADLLYDRPTAAALGHRVAEALRGGSAVLVGDPGRPGRAPFEDVVGEALGSTVTASCRGAARQTVKGKEDYREVLVDVFEFSVNKVASKVISPEVPCVVIRPAQVGQMSVVESTCFA